MKKIWLILGIVIFSLVLLLGVYLNHLDIKSEDFIKEDLTVFMNFENTYKNREILKQIDEEFQIKENYAKYIKSIFLLRRSKESQDKREDFILGINLGFVYPFAYYPVSKYFNLGKNGIFRLKNNFKNDILPKDIENVYLKIHRGYLIFSISENNLEEYMGLFDKKANQSELKKAYKRAKKTGLINGFVDLDKMIKNDEKKIRELPFYGENIKKIDKLSRFFDKLGILSFEYSYEIKEKKLLLDMIFNFKGKVMELFDSGEKKLKSKISRNSVYISSASFKNIADIIFDDYREQGKQYDIPYKVFSGEDPKDTADNLGDELVFYIDEKFESFSITSNLKNRKKMITVLERLKGIANFKKIEGGYLLSKGIKLSLGKDNLYINKRKRKFLTRYIGLDEFLYSEIDMGLFSEKYKDIDFIIRAKKEDGKLRMRVSTDINKVKKLIKE